LPDAPSYAANPVRIAVIGQTTASPSGSLDRSGALALALRQQPGVDVTLRAIAASDAECTAIDAALTAAGIVSQVTARTDGDPAPIRLGDTLDIWGLFAHDLVILDADDAPLRAFLTDLPAHTAPGVRILGTLDYVRGGMAPRERDIALRFDTIAGTADQAALLFGLTDGIGPRTVATTIGETMRGSNLRAAAIHDTRTLAIAALDEPAILLTLPEAMPRERVIAAVAITMARRDRWTEAANLLT